MLDGARVRIRPLSGPRSNPVGAAGRRPPERQVSRRSIASLQAPAGYTPWPDGWKSSRGVASAPLSFFLLVATGRTGLPFLSQALARGHFATIHVRNVSKLSTVLILQPHLRAFTGELHEADKVTLAMTAA